MFYVVGIPMKMTETQIDKQSDPPDQDDDENAANGSFNETEETEGLEDDGICLGCGELYDDCCCDEEEEDEDE